jgi:hypothetical protein
MIILHRVNNIDLLKEVPSNYGVEIDLRGYGDKILMSHEPIVDKKILEYTSFEDFLKHWNHTLMVINIKEMGYEKRIIELLENQGIQNYFFQDAEFPFIYKATRFDKMRKVSIRFSEAEPIENVLAQIDKEGVPLLDWVWIDTNTKLSLTKKEIPILKKFKTCLVCPERWGRPEDIENYIKELRSLDFKLDAVMTSKKYAKKWEKSGVIKS